MKWIASSCAPAPSSDPIAAKPVPRAVADYLALARMLARRAVFRYPAVDFDDAYSDALTGWLRADQRCTSEATFPALAKLCMQSAIIDGMRRRSIVNVRKDSVWLRRHGGPPDVVPFDDAKNSAEDSSAGQALRDLELWAAVASVLTPFDLYVVRSTIERELTQRVLALELHVLPGVIQCALARAYRILAVPGVIR